MSVGLLKLACSCGATFEAHKDSMSSRHEPGIVDLGNEWHRMHAPCRKSTKRPERDGKPCAKCERDGLQIVARDMCGRCYRDARRATAPESSRNAGQEEKQ